jgi:hypothetical protein
VSTVVHEIDRIAVVFDDDNAVAAPGLLLAATLITRLRLESLINATVKIPGRAGGTLPGRKVLTIVATLLAGGTHIDHADLLRSGDTHKVLPFRVMAPSTLGTFLRGFTFGHIRQLDKVIATALTRAWAAGAGPADGEPVVIDLDSTICRVYGKAKAGAAYGYTKVLGYHPLLATLAGTGEVLHARMRKGSSQRGHNRFIEELIARVRRAGATGPITVRADAGFFAWKLVDTLTRLGVAWSVTVRINPSMRTAIEAIDDDAWVDITYPDGGRAQVADTTYTTGQGRKKRSVRLVVRRTRLTEKAQQRLWPDWRHHAFVTNLDGTAVDVDRHHRAHAVVELNIRDLKEGAGMEHCPSGVFFANAAWLACAVLAHNLLRWTVRLGGMRPDELVVTRTIRRQLIDLPGRLVNLSGTPTLRMPTNWPWRHSFTRALDALRAVPTVPV